VKKICIFFFPWLLPPARAAMVAREGRVRVADQGAASGPGARGQHRVGRLAMDLVDLGARSTFLVDLEFVELGAFG